MRVSLAIPLLLVVVLLDLGNSHGANVWRSSIHGVSHPQFGQPVDVMTDVINDLGVKLLDCYIERPGNVAFSPTGLAFVLTALYEGSAGRTSRQIAHVLGLPRDRRITEIGLRDIHRRLRSYLNADAFLGGLTLNRDDITLRSQYEETLRFYGFDVGNMQTNGTDAAANGTMTNNNNNNNNNTTTAGATPPDAGVTTITPDMQDATDSSGATSSVMMVTAPSPVDAPVTNSMDATTNPNAELINNATDSSGMSANIVNIMNSTTTATSNNTAPAVNATITTTPTTPMTSAAENMESNGMNNPTIVNVTATTSASTVSTSSTLLSTESANNTGKEIVNATTITPVTAETNNSFMNDSTPSATNPVMDSTILNSQNSSTMILPVLAITNTTDTNDTNNLRRKRSHRHLSNYLAEGIWIDDSSGWHGYNSPAPLDDGILNEDMTDLQFLINGCDLSTISTATYTAALPFAYIPSLRSYGVEFPLDDPRYNVILLVPTEGTNNRILARLLKGKTLRYIRDIMKPTWVKATIPSFMLRGFITLTPYLQKLGIKDAFEPRAADLSPMSPDLGIYARDIQQSIGVNIRNYLRDGTNESTQAVPNTRAPYQQSGNYLHAREAVPFIVDRPFLFFIVDNQTSVALIAGRIDDPLNSRII